MKVGLRGGRNLALADSGGSNLSSEVLRFEITKLTDPKMEWLSPQDCGARFQNPNLDAQINAI
ncbi:MAG: hypothetical protein HQK58_16240 [Deltaproteobacteria bacterium]|nr:hypothetical protein [Deltaproteobacteria bacterium]